MGVPRSAREPISLHALGVGSSAFGAIACSAAAVGGLAHLLLTDLLSPVLIATTIAATSAAIALLVLRSRARRAVGEPVARCVAALQRLANRQSVGRLPEHGTAQILALVRTVNDTVEAVSKRDVARTDELEQAESAFAWDHMVLESLRDAVVVLDAGGRVVSANASAVQWFDLRDATIRGSSGSELLPGEPGKALGDAVHRITAGHATEVQTTGMEQGRRRIDLNVVAMQGSSDSRMTGMVAAFTDVTRNHELARLRDDLLSSISHELRTPLTNLCSSSEILAQLDPAHEPDWRDFVHILHTESHRLKSLVDDVMSYRQVENSRTEWHIEPHDADRLARDAVKLTSLMVKKAAIAVDLQIESSAAVLCDGPRILEVLVRLVDNACKFGHRGGHIRLHVSALEDRVEFAVADDGPGIELPDRQRVFDRFVQVGDVLTDKPKGAGLGLSICQRIVDAMGGAIWCEDSPLGGVQVRFMLPLARGAAAMSDGRAER